MAAVGLALGPFTVRMRARRDPLWRPRLRGWYGPYGRDAARPDVDLDVRIDPSLARRRVPPRLSPAPRGFRVEGPGFQAALARIHGRWRGHAAVKPDPMVIDSLLRTLGSPCFLPDGALLLAAAVERRGGVHLLLGPVGSGKTPTAWRFPAAAIYNDDLTFAYRARDGWRVASTPFLGNYRAPRPRAGLIAELEFLERGARPGRIGPTEAARRLLHVIHVAPGHAGVARRALAFARDLASAVPARTRRPP